MSDSWDDSAEGWDDDPFVRAYAEAAHTSLRAELGARSVELAGARVLDFGCGTGLLAERLVDEVDHIDAVDIAPKMLQVLDAKIEARRWSNVATSTTLPLGTTWDLVVCSSVLAFVDDHPATVAELAGRLQPGGLFVHWDWEATGVDDHGLTREAVAAALEQAGLTGIRVDTAFSVTVDGHEMAPVIGTGRRPG